LTLGPITAALTLHPLRERFLGSVRCPAHATTGRPGRGGLAEPEERSEMRSANGAALLTRVPRKDCNSLAQRLPKA